MFARTVEEMINLLDGYSTDIPITDEYENRYTIRQIGFEQIRSFRGVIVRTPVLFMQKRRSGHPDHGDTVFEFLSALLGISMDERFSGGKSKLKHCDTNNKKQPSDDFVMARLDTKPVLFSVSGYGI